MAVASGPIRAPIREASSSASLVSSVGAVVLLGVLMGVALVVGELQAFWIGVSVIAAAAVMYDFRIGAALLIMLLPIGASTLFPRSLFGITGLNPLNVVMLATLASFILHGRVERAGAFAPRQVVWLYVVPILVAGMIGSRSAHLATDELLENLAIHFTGARGYLQDMVIKPLFTVLIALLIGAAVARSKKPERFLVPIGAAVWVLSFLAIWRVSRTSLSLGDIASASNREFFSMAIGLHANDLGRLFAVAYALLLFAWAESKEKWFRLACLATMGMVVMALVFTFSRGAFAGFLVVNALFLLWRFNLKTAALLVVAGVAFVALLPPEVWMRLSMGMGEGADAVSAGRIEGIWGPLVPELLNSPLWGNGIGSVMWSEPMTKGMMSVVTHPHNAYLELYYDMGLIGVGLVLAYFAHVWKGFRALGSNAFLSPEMRGFYKGAAAGLVSFFVTGFAGSSFVPKPEYAFLWIAIGMMYGHLARRPQK